MGYFNQIADNPDNALTLLIAGAVKIMEGIALFGIALAKGIVLTIIDIVIDIVGAVKDLMNEEWEIPVVSQLYKLITGKTLSFRPISLISIIAAIPGTLFYKIIFDVAPFPDDAALARFTDQYTAEWLAGQAGIGGFKAQKMSAAEAAAAEEWRKWVSGIFGCVCAAVWVFRVWPDTAGVVITTFIPATKRLKIAAAIVGFSTIFLTVPWIVRENAGGFDCTSLSGLSNLRWLLNAVMAPGLGAVYAFVGAPGYVPDLSVTIWGAANLGLVVTTAFMGAAATVVAENIFTTLAPQLFRILNVKEIWTPEIVIFTKLGLIVTIVLTYPTIAGLHIANSVGEPATAANERLLGLTQLPQLAVAEVESICREIFAAEGRPSFSGDLPSDVRRLSAKLKTAGGARQHALPCVLHNRDEALCSRSR